MLQRMPLNSIQGPPTSSDSAAATYRRGGASGRRRRAAMKMKNPSGCQTMNGTRPCFSTISTRFREPASIDSASTAKISGTS